ncbi:MAG: hypothetical protein ABTR54_14155, partial [Candidatus Competibacter sp.]
MGRANEVVSRVLKEPDLFDTLISGMLLNDPVLRMRCADVVERVTAIHPEYLLPYKTRCSTFPMIEDGMAARHG